MRLSRFTNAIPWNLAVPRDSIPVFMYAPRMVAPSEEPLSSEQILERFTKIFRREVTAVERRARVIR